MISLRRRLGVVTAVAALGLFAMGGSAFAKTYTAFGKEYQVKTINGVDVAVTDDGMPLWGSVPDENPVVDPDLPVDRITQVRVLDPYFYR